MSTKASPEIQASAKPAAPALAFAFDVGHSSIGWSVLTAPPHGLPDILGCGTVLFEKDSALANQRRLHRQQRRHVRATRQRIRRLERLLAHIGAIPEKEIAARHIAAAGHPTPWLLAARVLASDGAKTLTWPEFWDVLRWYAHNRGYEPIGQDDDEDENREKREQARTGMARYGTSTMAETICAWLGQNPLATRAGTTVSYKGQKAAFDRSTVREEVRHILTAHLGKLPGIDAAFIAAVVDDARALEIPGLKLPNRFDNPIYTPRTGGLLFGRLGMRYDNRIIGLCPFHAHELEQRHLAAGKSPEEARHLAEKEAKLPSKDCPEYYRFRWAMLLANISVAAPADPGLRRLTAAERRQLTEQAARDGYFTPGEFRKTVRALTGAVRDNLDQMFMDATAAENLVLDPALRLVHSKDRLKDVWPHLPETVRKHALNRWRRGRTQTLAALRAEAATAGHDLAAFDTAIAVLCTAKSKRPKKSEEPPPTTEAILATPFSTPMLGGRAPHARPILVRATEQAMAATVHPREEGGCLFETPDLRRSRERRTLDQQTNNHLVRHRLLILGRLIAQLVADPAYGAGKPARVSRITLEVNRDLRDMAGLTAQDIAKEMNERLRSHGKVSKRLTEELPPEYQSRINASLIRKARIADDLGWRCPYTGLEFEPIDLVTKRVDLDHIIPRSQRTSDSLDSLVVTFSEINKWKGARTAWQFMKEFEAKPVPGLPQYSLKQLKRYAADVETLDKRGHPDDIRRKKRRIEKLLLENYEEKAGGFTPGQLTQTSQLSRLGQQVLRKPFAHLEDGPAFVALPGQVTGRIRTAWDVLGCLADAAPGILETTTDADGRAHRTVKTKTEIRDITHLHHALDACVLGLAAASFPNNGEVWRALLERRPNPAQRTLLERLDLGEFDASGGFRLRALPEAIKQQLRTRLAERRIVQHVPADMSGIRVEENTRGIVKREDGRVWLRQRKANAKGEIIINRGDEPENKLMGLRQPGDLAGKLAAQKGVRVITDNFGVAILDDEKLPPAERFVILPFARVWQQLQALQLRNGGRRPQVWRNGQIINIPKGARAGLWRIYSIKNNTSGMALDLGSAEATRATWINVLLKSLLRDGAILQNTSRLTGLAG